MAEGTGGQFPGLGGFHPLSYTTFTPLFRSDRTCCEQQCRIYSIQKGAIAYNRYYTWHACLRPCKLKYVPLGGWFVCVGYLDLQFLRSGKGSKGRHKGGNSFLKWNAPVFWAAPALELKRSEVIGCSPRGGHTHMKVHTTDSALKHTISCHLLSHCSKFFLSSACLALIWNHHSIYSSMLMLSGKCFNWSWAEFPKRKLSAIRLPLFRRVRGIKLILRGDNAFGKPNPALQHWCIRAEADKEEEKIKTNLTLSTRQIITVWGKNNNMYTRHQSCM